MPVPGPMLALGACLALALTGCGSSSAPKASGAHAALKHASPVNVFATHAGLAFGVFYRYIYAPYRAGRFSPAARDRAALSRATLAAKFVADQLEQATVAAHESTTLAKLIAPLHVLDEGFRTALVKLRSGHFKMSEIEAANLAISAIKGSAMQAGLPITESTPSAI